ncbi:unnamed protein product [Schistosoma turkestanicum]|nr:unnamed protein product [Schistosoma turkestanicum]
MIPEAMTFWVVSAHVGWNYYMMRPLYARFYRTVLLGIGTYVAFREVEKAIKKRKVTHLKAIDVYKSQFPERVPVKNIQGVIDFA